ncbi:MAG: pyridoxamine 5'-phosphate oxidase [Legionellaceae bacterium]|nr:pyridoxamine 5'-phosphate oxidase [Legionellaceae bacterium]
MSRFELSTIREEYSGNGLLDNALVENPLIQFDAWLNEHLSHDKETPNSMVLSTVDEHGCPDSRIVLLKGLDNGNFVFYTNYYSAKGLQLKNNPHAALNFYWPELMRQVRVRGTVIRVDKKQADEYFYSRPVESQLSAIASPQSAEIANRDELQKAFNKAANDYTDKKIERPEYWGGYAVVPNEIEFWQGRESRLHDRIQYYREKDAWCHRRLAP